MERKMEEIADLLEHELESAVEVKDPGSLKRFVRLLTEGAVGKPEYSREVTLLHNDIAALTEAMKRGFDEMNLRFQQMEKRFDQIDKRFEQVDKRFEQVDKRFEQVDKRFEQIDKRFDDLIHQMDNRFNDLIHQMDKRFEQVDKRFEDVNKRFVMMFSFMTVGFTILALLITVFG
jgi:septation ring formation regulator EzrA